MVRTSRARFGPWLAAVLLLAVAASCTRRPAGGQAGVGSPGRSRSEAFIDAGNESYRSGNFELALKRYAAAAVADPRDPAAYFGMGMTFTRLKREDEARAAFARARFLAHEARPK
jgi:Tfp pilus assembly protein PilF